MNSKARDASTMTVSAMAPLPASSSVLNAFNSLYSSAEEVHAHHENSHDNRREMGTETDGSETDFGAEEYDEEDEEDEEEEEQLIRHRFPPLTEEQRRILAADTFPYPPPSSASSSPDELSLSTFAWLSGLFCIAFLVFSSLAIVTDYILFSLSPSPLSFSNAECFSLHSFLAPHLYFSSYFSLLSIISLLVSAFASSYFLSHSSVLLTCVLLLFVGPSLFLLSFSIPIASLLYSSWPSCSEMSQLLPLCIVCIISDVIFSAVCVSVVGVFYGARVPDLVQWLRRGCGRRQTRRAQEDGEGEGKGDGVEMTNRSRKGRAETEELAMS